MIQVKKINHTNGNYRDVFSSCVILDSSHQKISSCIHYTGYFSALDELLKKLTDELEDVKEKGIHTAKEINVLHDENEKHKGDLKIIENDAATFQEKVYITINDNKDEADVTSKRLGELAEDVKENTEKIEALKIGEDVQKKEYKDVYKVLYLFLNVFSFNFT